MRYLRKIQPSIWLDRVQEIVISLAKLPYWLLSLAVWAVFYYPVWQGKIPLPADLLLGAYWPWYAQRAHFYTNGVVKNPLLSDVISQIYVWKQVAANLIAQGQWPLWNQYSFSGTPLLANFHSASLFPTTLLMAWNMNLGWTIHIILASLTAIWGMHYWLQRYRLSVSARLAAGFVFAFGGLMTTWTELGHATWGMALLPWLLWTSQLKHRLSGPAVGLIWGLIILSGHSQVVMITTITLLLYQLFNYHHGLDYWKNLLKLGFWLVVGSGMVALQLLPSWQFMAQSIRPWENYTQTDNYGLLNWTELIRLLVADFWGHPARRNQWGTVSYQEASSYLAALSLPFVLTTLSRLWPSRRSQHRSWLWFNLTLLILSLAISINQPASRWLFSHPISFLTKSFASRWLFLTGFAAANLMAWSWDQIWHNRKSLLLWRSWIGMLSLLLLGLYLWGQKSAAEHFAVWDKPVLLSLTILLVAAGISLVLRHYRILAKTGLLFLLLIDLFFYFHQYNPFVKPEIIFPSHDLIQQLKHKSGYFVSLDQLQRVMPANTWTAYGLKSLAGYDPLYYYHYARGMSILEDNSTTSGLTRYLQLNRLPIDLLPTLAVSSVLSYQPADASQQQQLTQAGYQLAWQQEPVFLYQASKPVTLWQTPSQVVIVPSLSQAEDKLLQIRPHLATTAVVIADQPADQATVNNSAQVKVWQQTDQTLGLTVTQSQPGWFIWKAGFDPGWQLKVNGQTKHWSQANLIWRAVYLRAGKHQIYSWYYPAIFAWGQLISLWSLAFWLAWSMWQGLLALLSGKSHHST